MRKNKVEKILYDISLLCTYKNHGGNRTGIFWVTYNILKSLSEHKSIKVYLYAEDFTLGEETANDFLKNISHQGMFYGDVKDMDLFFSAHAKVPDEIRKTNIPCSIILHDCIPLIFPQYFDDEGKGWFNQMINTLNNDDMYFSNSEYTKSDFLKFCPRLKTENIKTIPLSTNISYSPNNDANRLKVVKQKYNIPTDKKYLFSLCSLEPRKNLIRAVRSFIQFIEKNNIDDLVFVLGGGAWDGFIKKFEKEVPEYQKYKDKIIRAGYVDDEDLEILYSNAEWFVYTSQYEGFGMPPLEAMSCSCPVITSNNSSLPEVVGDAGIMIDWDSDEQHVKAYEQYYFDRKYRDEMAKKGLKRSKQFSWEKAADIIVDAFNKRDLTRKRTSFNLSNLIKQNNITKISVKLFNFIPLFKYKQIGGRKVYKILGLPIFKIRKMANGITTKYYILGIPVLKISKRS